METTRQFKHSRRFIEVSPNEEAVVYRVISDSPIVEIDTEEYRGPYLGTRHIYEASWGTFGFITSGDQSGWYHECFLEGVPAQYKQVSKSMMVTC